MTIGEAFLQAVPKPFRSTKACRRLADRMDALGIVGCEDSMGELVERVFFTCVQKKIRELTGEVSRNRARRWIQRAIRKARESGGVQGVGINRPMFHARRRVCHRCENWREGSQQLGTKDGCRLLKKPCQVEFLWMSASEDWCPDGKVAYVPHFSSNRSPKVTPPKSWTHKITPRSRTAFVTFAIGKNANELRPFTMDRMERYAKQCGADFHCFSDDQFPDFPIGNKWRLSEIGRCYDKVVYMDIDIWIEDTLPNLFRLKDGVVWWFAEKAWWKPRANWWHPQDVEMLEDTQGITAPQDLDIRNTGVVVFNREHAEMWRQPKLPFRLSHTAEQTWVEIQAAMLGYRLGRLPMTYNMQVWMRRLWGRRWSHIYHLAGSPHEYRLEWLEKRRSGVKAEEIQIPITWKWAF